MSTGPVVLVHGGASARLGDGPDLEAGCRTAAEAGATALADGGTALDAVVAAVRVLEDDPRFNAGTGAALTEAGTIELDASVMEGTGREAGGVAVLGPFPNPVSVARAVLDEGRHVLYAGAGADAFARRAGFESVDPERLVTERSRELLDRWRSSHERPPVLDTVGAVAVDGSGATAAATSTGGVVGQRPGRVGDAPIPGSGTYADDRSGAISCTGSGEAILRAVMAHDAVQRLHDGRTVAAAAAEACDRLGADFQGQGGLIAVSRTGEIGSARNTAAMPWAAVRPGGGVESGH